MAINWDDLRDQEFPIARNWAYFDHAAVAPIPQRSANAMNQWVADSLLNGAVYWPRWADKLNKLRDNIALLLNADRDEVALALNTTHGLTIFAEGFPFEPGDNVVSVSDEFPSNVYPWINLESRGVNLRRVPVRDERIWLEDLEAAIDSRTRVLTISHVEFASGFRNDLDQIGALCRRYGVAFCVDAIQGLGSHLYDVKKTPIDFLAADGHKWLLGPEGAGLIYIKREWIERLHPIMLGWHSVVHCPDHSRIEFNLKPSAERWEGGSFAMAGLQGFAASLELFHELGPAAVSQRIGEQTQRVRELAQESGWTIMGSNRPEDQSAIVVLDKPGCGLNHKETVNRFRSMRVVVSCRGGRLRISPHIYNNDQDFERLGQALASV